MRCCSPYHLKGEDTCNIHDQGLTFLGAENLHHLYFMGSRDLTHVFQVLKKYADFFLFYTSLTTQVCINVEYKGGRRYINIHMVTPISYSLLMQNHAFQQSVCLNTSVLRYRILKSDLLCFLRWEILLPGIVLGVKLQAHVCFGGCNMKLHLITDLTVLRCE